MSTEPDNNAQSAPVPDSQQSEQRKSADRREVDRRVLDRRELAAQAIGSTPPAPASEPAQNRRSGDRRDTDRRSPDGARRANDATPAPLGYELRLEPRGPGGYRKASEITTTKTVSVEALRENGLMVLDRLAREFHQEVVNHFRQNLPRVQLLRATVDCISPLGDLSAAAASDTVEVTLRATCLCRRKPGSGRKPAAE